MNEKATAVFGDTQRQFIRTKQVVLGGPPDDLLAFGEGLSDWDQQLDARRKLTGTIAAVFALLSFLSIFLGAFMSDKIEGSMANLGWVVLGFCVCVFLFALVIYLTCKSRDIPNRFRNFIIPLIRILKEDNAAGNNISCLVDLSGLAKHSIVAQYEGKPVGPYYRVKCTDYVCPWLKIKSSLVDGSQLEIEIVDHVTKLQKTKRNARGKTKSKTKYKSQSRVTATVLLSKRFYSIPDQAQFEPSLVQGPKDKAAIRDGSKFYKIATRRAAKFPGYDADNFDLDMVVGILTDIYSQTQLLKKVG